jgi:hypothetical protein
MSFNDELSALLNKYSKENASDTPDFILAQYISDCLDTFSQSIIRRDKWYGFKTLTMDHRLVDPPNPSDDGRASARPVNHVVGQTLPEQNHV